MTRFAGTVARLGPVDVSALVAWITRIPFEAWPQQARLNGELRPAMVNDLTWHHFGAVTDATVTAALGWFPGGEAVNRLLSVVMPGQAIDPHVDKTRADWITRVHVPLTSSPESAFLVGGESHHLEVGFAYQVNIRAAHGVTNPGTTPRVHFMCDVVGA